MFRRVNISSLTKGHFLATPCVIKLMFSSAAQKIYVEVIVYKPATL